MSAMKVGTDSILLSAWMNHPALVQRVLDIGSGTGILSLRAARCFPDAEILAVEIESGASEECRYNVDLNNDSERIEVINRDIRDYHTEERFQLILSNPPFFNGLVNDSKRRLARIEDGLPLEHLMRKVEELLAYDGLFQMILPFSRMKDALSIADSHHLFLQKCCYVSSRKGQEPIRVLMSMGRERKTMTEHSTLNIYEGGHYSSSYIDFTQEVYGKDVSGLELGD